MLYSLLSIFLGREERNFTTKIGQDINELSRNSIDAFKEVVDQFHSMNDARSEVSTIGTEFKLLPTDLSLEIRQAFLSSLQTLTWELGELVREQPQMLKEHLELAVQIDEEKKWVDETQDKMQTKVQ